MQQKDHTQVFSSHNERPKLLFKSPSLLTFTDEDDDPDATLLNEPQSTDVAVMPTMVLPAVSRLLRGPRPFTSEDFDNELEDDLDPFSMSAIDLMQLSGIMKAVTIELPRMHTGGVSTISRTLTSPLSEMVRSTDAIATPSLQPPWKAALNSPITKAVIGLVLGVLIILLMVRFANIPKAAQTLQARLTTPESTFNALMHASFAALAFLGAFAIRGTRWRLFLSRVGKVKTFTVIRIFWIATFINFLLPVQGGEIAKSLMLKRVTGIPINQSLPTVAIDKALDLMPALIITVLVPFLPGIRMNLTLWILLGCVSGVLVGLILVTALTAWKRNLALQFIGLFLKILPKGIAAKIEGFAMGLVDSLLAGASNPKVFIPAVFLTVLAVCCDGLFAMQGFAAVGLNMPFGEAIFGYMVYNMFSILPSPPGQVGTSEFAGLTAFHFLLGFKEQDVLAMFIASHPLCATIMCSAALISSHSLGLKLFNLMGPQHEEKGVTQKVKNKRQS